MSTHKKILLSGVKPTGIPHIGNYFGAMRQFVNLQNSGEYDNLFMIADYHALTTSQNREELSRAIFDVITTYLAIGIDPERSVIFKQSDVSEHTELSWIFDCITTMPYLMRAHAYKDAEAKNKEISVGTFNYPMLMAADILLYDTDVVPVGADQKQHVEYARDTAEKFNRIFGESFKLPDAHILEGVAVVPGIDGRKMSKSYGNTIPLFAEDAEIDKLVMSIVTDSKGVSDIKDPVTDNVFALHKLFSTPQEIEELEVKYREGQIGYADSKKLLSEKVRAFVQPLREKKKELENNREHVLTILKKGGEEARVRAEKKMSDVRNKVGVSIY